MVAGDPVVIMLRLKREGCKRTKHDREFSKWEEGAERYRVHNLPQNSDPGVFELGIAVSQTGLGRERGKLDPACIVVVYLGQAENVRTQLQRYCRTGAHLGNSCPTDFEIVTPQKGPRLFEVMLSRGYPIVFRWASMQSKSNALKPEIDLLNTFDYAWNTSINGTRCPDDILDKLKKSSLSNILFSDIARKLVPFSQKQVGIRIKASIFPSAEGKNDTFDDEDSHSPFSRVFKFGRSQPRLVLDRSVVLQENTTICGAVLGHDTICRRPPVEGRKRCAAISNSNVNAQSTLAAPSSSHDLDELQSVTFNRTLSESFTPICGFILADGSPCISPPLKRNKRCHEHEGRRIQKPNSVSVTSYQPDLVSKSDSFEICFSREVQAQAVPKRSNTNRDKICGVVLDDDGFLCTRKPVVGRVRCQEHKGTRVNRLPKCVRNKIPVV